MPALGGIGKVDHQHLLRAMDALFDHQAAINEVLTGRLRPQVDQERSVVFYEMTTMHTKGLTELRHYGRVKDGAIRRQVMLGMVQTAEGLPPYHEVFEGNTADVKTLQPTLEAIVQCFPVKRVVVVADRDLLSIDNLAKLQQTTLPSGAPMEFILVVPGRQYNDFEAIVDPLQQTQFRDTPEEVINESGG